MDWIKFDDRLPKVGRWIVATDEYMEGWIEQFDPEEPLGHAVFWLPIDTSEV